MTLIYEFGLAICLIAILILGLIAVGALLGLAIGVMGWVADKISGDRL